MSHDGTLAFLGAGVGLPLLIDGSRGGNHALRTGDALLTSALVSEGLKLATREQRPDGTSRDSFPSGHATAAFAVAAMESHYHRSAAPLWYLGRSGDRRFARHAAPSLPARCDRGRGLGRRGLAPRNRRAARPGSVAVYPPRPSRHRWRHAPDNPLDSLLTDYLQPLEGFPTLNRTTHNRMAVSALTALTALTAALSLGALLAASGCTHDNDPNAAPYGTTASPSAVASAPAVAVASPAASAQPLASASPLAPFVKPSDTATPASNKPVATGASGTPGAPPLSGMAGGMPMMGMGGDPNAPMTPTPDLDTKIADATKSGAKPAIAAAYAERGTYRMNDANGGARIKYRMALMDYREALKADPTNAGGAEEQGFDRGHLQADEATDSGVGFLPSPPGPLSPRRSCLAPMERGGSLVVRGIFLWRRQLTILDSPSLHRSEARATRGEGAGGVREVSVRARTLMGKCHVLLIPRQHSEHAP